MRLVVANRAVGVNQVVRIEDVPGGRATGGQNRSERLAVVVSGKDERARREPPLDRQLHAVVGVVQQARVREQILLQAEERWLDVVNGQRRVRQRVRDG